MSNILRVGRHNVIPPIMQIRVIAPRSAAAAAGWWVVPGKTCVAAYQPKGAASYAASKVNLQQPGTYDATDGAAYPTWNTATGWTFSVATLTYLRTGVSINGGNHSVLVRFANVPSSGASPRLCGSSLAGNSAPRMVLSYGPRTYIYGTTVVQVSPEVLSGVIGIAGRQGYLNGGADGAGLGVWAGTNNNDLWLGQQNNNGAPGFGCSGDLIAVAVYSDTLTAGEVATVSAAMAAL